MLHLPIETSASSKNAVTGIAHTRRDRTLEHLAARPSRRINVTIVVLVGAVFPHCCKRSHAACESAQTQGKKAVGGHATVLTEDKGPLSLRATARSPRLAWSQADLRSSSSPVDQAATRHRRLRIERLIFPLAREPGLEKKRRSRSSGPSGPVPPFPRTVPPSLHALTTDATGRSRDRPRPPSSVSEPFGRAPRGAPRGARAPHAQASRRLGTLGQSGQMPLQRAEAPGGRGRWWDAGGARNSGRLTSELGSDGRGGGLWWGRVLPRGGKAEGHARVCVCGGGAVGCRIPLHLRL